MNGREWLSRQLDTAEIAYKKDDNCFVRIDNIEKAQLLLPDQTKRDWPESLDKIIGFISKPMAAIA